MKPPVEAPTSRQSRPVTSIPSSSSALASFSPPRETKRARSATISSASGSTSSLGFSATGPSAPTRTSPARTEAGRGRARREQAPLGKNRVDSLPGHAPTVPASPRSRPRPL